MKRFYCTICKRLKRVRKYPTSVREPHATLPQDRVGECTRHFAPVRTYVKEKPANEAQEVARLNTPRNKKSYRKVGQ